ncbi:MAG TPA: cytochrome ubiquinol oxidase subunit I [Streptosporangiaceae bacterium]
MYHFIFVPPALGLSILVAILAANSWMQHPVGYKISSVTHRAELTSIVKLLTNSTVLAAWPHVWFASFLIAGAVVVAASAWHLAAGTRNCSAGRRGWACPSRWPPGSPRPSAATSRPG